MFISLLKGNLTFVVFCLLVIPEFIRGFICILYDFIFWRERDWDSGFYHYPPDSEVPEELLKLTFLDPSPGDSDSVGIDCRVKPRTLIFFFLKLFR